MPGATSSRRYGLDRVSQSTIHRFHAVWCGLGRTSSTLPPMSADAGRSWSMAGGRWVRAGALRTAWHACTRELAKKRRDCVSTWPCHSASVVPLAESMLQRLCFDAYAKMGRRNRCCRVEGRALSLVFPAERESLDPNARQCTMMLHAMRAIRRQAVVQGVREASSQARSVQDFPQSSQPTGLVGGSFADRL